MATPEDPKCNGEQNEANENFQDTGNGVEFGDEKKSCQMSTVDTGVRNRNVMNQRITVNRQLYTEDGFNQKYQGEEDRQDANGGGLAQRLKRSAGSCNQRRVFNFFSTQIFPILHWLPRYKVKENLLHDLIAGFTIGTFNIPQGMSYALLASMPPVVGLYLSFFAPLLYAITGTSKHIAQGTFAIVSLMSGVAIEAVVPLTDPELDNQGDGALSTLWDNTTGTTPALSTYDRDYEKVLAATVLAFMTGVIQLILGICQLGFVSIYLSNPLVRGFTTGAACHVAVSQLKYLFGLKEYAGNHSGILSIIYALIDVFEDIGKTNYVEVLISLSCIVVLAIFKVINKKYKKQIKFPIPIELILIIIFTAISSPLNLSSGHSVAIVGNIPTGIPAPAIPGFKYANALIGDAFSIAIVLFSINISLARLFAKTHNYEIHPNVEMRSYGIGNLFVSFFGCFPTGCSLSRSLVQEQTGCKTQVTGVVNSIFMLVVLLAIGPLFEPLPNAILASIIIVNLKGMFLQFEDIYTLWKADKIDLSVWFVTFIATIFLDLDLGLLVGFLYGLFSVVLRIQLPRSYPLGNVADTGIYKNVHQIKQAVEVPGVKIFCYEAPICYANAQNFTSRLAKATGINPLMKKKTKKERSELELDVIVKGDFEKTSATIYVVGNSEGITKFANGDSESARAAANGDLENAKMMANDCERPQGSRGPALHTVVLDMGACSFLDTVGTHTLLELASSYRNNFGVRLVLACCSHQVLSALDHEVKDQDDAIPTYVSVHDAVTAALAGSDLSNDDLVSRMKPDCQDKESSHDQDDVIPTHVSVQDAATAAVAGRDLSNGDLLNKMKLDCQDEESSHDTNGDEGTTYSNEGAVFDDEINPPEITTL